MNLVFLCGAGGAGKTSVLLELGRSKSIDCISSSSRNTFARLGIADEEASLRLSKDERENLQIEILNDYMKAVTNGVQRALLNDNCNLCVVDRSPYDHLSYWLRAFSLSPNFDIVRYRRTADQIREHLEHFPCKMFFADFHAPTTWEVAADGQRSDDKLKRLQASLQITGIVQQETGFNPDWHHQCIPEDTVANRALAVLEFVRKFSN